MKALIFNSGTGSRLGELTADKPKCLVRLGNGETIFHRQLRVLHACGVREFVVTTGPFAQMVEAEAAPFRDAGCAFSFVNNPIYDKTNYIYSMYLARDLLADDDFLLLHGDLVFDAAYAQAVVDSPLPSLGSVNAALPLPEKDFKARVAGGEVREVSVGIFDGDCVAFQPFYKLSREAMSTWLAAVGRFVEQGETGVYAEDAANTVFGEMHVAAFSYEDHFVEEIDTPEDLARVSAVVRLFDFAQQPVYRVGAGCCPEAPCHPEPKAEDPREAASSAQIALVDGFASAALRGVSDVAGVLAALGVRRPLVVTAPFFPSLGIARALDGAGVEYVTFTDFNPNPSNGDVARALAAFGEAGCDSLLSVGGGSAIDVAKCVKQLLALPDGATGDDLKVRPLPYSGIPHVAVPTTAGTGSESTHFAVCYVDAVKVSVANDCLQPDAVLLDASSLAGLPDYQKKCTLLDALCQAIESHWSSRSTVASRAYSARAIPAIMDCAEAYLAGDADAAAAVMRAANQAGKAINLTTTTAPHAMSYKLTSLFGIPHGHAVAMCMPHCWQALLAWGDGEVQARLTEIAALMTGDSDAMSTASADGLVAFERLFSSLGIAGTVDGTADDVDMLVSSVNVERLSNFPLALSADDLAAMYSLIVNA